MFLKRRSWERHEALSGDAPRTRTTTRISWRAIMAGSLLACVFGFSILEVASYLYLRVST